MTWNRAKSPWPAKLWFAASAISAMDALTSFTNWMNVAHHGSAQAATALGQASVFAAFAIYFTRHPAAR